MDVEQDARRVLLFVPDGTQPHFWIIDSKGFSAAGKDIQTALDREAAGNNANIVFFRSDGSLEVQSRALTRAPLEEFDAKIREDVDRQKLAHLRKKTSRVEWDIREIIKDEIKRSFDLREKIKHIDAALDEIHQEAGHLMRLGKPRHLLKSALGGLWDHEKEGTEGSKKSTSRSDSSDGEHSHHLSSKLLSKDLPLSRFIRREVRAETAPQAIDDDSTPEAGVSTPNFFKAPTRYIHRHRADETSKAEPSQNHEQPSPKSRLSKIVHPHLRTNLTASDASSLLSEKEKEPDAIEKPTRGRLSQVLSWPGKKTEVGDEINIPSKPRSRSPLNVITDLMTRNELGVWIKSQFAQITHTQDALRGRLIQQQDRLISHQHRLGEWYQQLRQEELENAT